MALPPGITKKLLQATSDKPDLNKQALRFNRSFKEVGKLLCSGSAKAKKDKDKKEPGLELSSPGIYIDKLLYDLGCNKRLYSKSSFIISIALTNEGFRGFITLK